MTRMEKPRIAILGAGPVGLGAAYRLVRSGTAHVVILEQHRWVGGTSGSFDLAGVRVDYGSHRLHPVCDPDVLADIRMLLGADLLDRPRHGRIRLRGHWIHFPLKPLDLALRLPPGFALGVTGDTARKVFRRNLRSGKPETFASILEATLGRTICRDFYFPYARKLWGIAPEELETTQARRRVSVSSMPQLIWKVLSALPGLRRPGSGRFMYPRRGFGQIAEAFARAAQEGGAEFRMGATVRNVELAKNSAHTVHYEEGGILRALQADHVWSTIPITTLTRCVQPAVPAECLQAAERIEYRGMILIYLVLEQPQFSEYDGHYFPGTDVPITRLSEPKNYSGGTGPSDRTVLCAELPCDPCGAEWTMSDGELGLLVCDALQKSGIPIRVPIEQVVTRRLREAYPVYRRGYEVHLGILDRYFENVDDLLTLGRQGLFVHDNAHHALYMGYCAAACLDEQGRFDRELWRAYRRIFATHVVED